MVVQHNLTAMNSNRMLGITTKTQAKSTEKLSSGYKINRAADDAAGLSISEKMRRQIRGLTQASANAQDGISAVQTAEGALTEVHDMLQRMNELAVKAANGTNQSEDQSYIQKEVDQLVAEIDRVSQTTTFNEKNLLDGSFSAVDLQVGSESNSGNRISVTINAMSASGISVNGLASSGVTSVSSAQNAISTIKSAIKAVSEQRSNLGAIQNRLEHTINNLDNVVENTTSAESQIRDTDMATEMVKYSNNNILAQAGQAMLAQANQSNQGVLSLLQ
ncbi:flagellin N-terminal helical domain-containing protein [Waltera intestinalis]|uniref:Flagellin n=1 Tax=Waltera intestinalis TaxID=2606635 RepID=A0A6L5YL47_9FIRM|nr:flagellin [Waltera intestinalis]MST58849.1 flagellin [Waltera intestinalis]